MIRCSVGVVRENRCAKIYKLLLVGLEEYDIIIPKHNMLKEYII